jgi:hypothetical protein
MWLDFAIVTLSPQEVNVKAVGEYKIAENDWRVTLGEYSVYIVSTVGGPARGQVC